MKLEEYLHGSNMAFLRKYLYFYILGKGQYSSRMEKLFECTMVFIDYTYIIRNKENTGYRKRVLGLILPS